MKFWDKIKDRWITWRTGKSKEQRDWEAWYEANVDYRAGNITTMFRNFKHVIEVDWQKFITDGGMTWVPVKDAQQYFWPQRELGENCVWRIERVFWDRWHKCWSLNDIGGEDKVFVATNSDKDAIMISLKYCG